MKAPDVLRLEIKVLAFDRYGTIVDMQKGLTDAVTPFLQRKGWDGEPNSLVTWWRRTHFENSMIGSLCDRGDTPYRHGHRAASFEREPAARAAIHIDEPIISQHNRPQWLATEHGDPRDAVVPAKRKRNLHVCRPP
jgi:hypothetical protein